MRASCLIRLAILVVVVMTTALPAQQAGDDRAVKQLIEAWNKRRFAMKTVEYRVEGVELLPKGAGLKKGSVVQKKAVDGVLPPDQSHKKTLVYGIRFDGGNIRKERRSSILMSANQKYIPWTRIMVFDGTNTKAYEPRIDMTSEFFSPSDAQPELKIYKGGYNKILNQEDYPLLFAHGRPQFYNALIDAAGYLDKTPDTSLLRYHQQGRISDRDCMVFRTVVEGGKVGRFDEFWVDMHRDAAILRWQGFKRGSPYIRYNVSYKPIQQNWLLDEYEFDLFDERDGVPVLLRSERMKVKAVTINPEFSSELVSIPMKHGMVVSNTQGDTFSVGSDDRTLVPYGANTYIWRWWHLIGGILAVAVAFGFIFWVRKNVRRSSS